MDHKGGGGAAIVRYHGLDALRGGAALLVCAYHFGQREGHIAQQGYLAVDLFFALSGFVIALNYAERLKAGYGVARFAIVRAIRLYPLYALGTAIGLVRPVIDLLGGAHDALGARTLGIAVLAGALVLPMPIEVHSLFPLNGPAWSLFVEAIANIAFALLLYRMASPLLAVLACGSALLFVTRIAAPDYLNLGWQWSQAPAGLGRAFFAFPIGMLAWRHLPRAPRRAGWWSLAPLGLLTILLCAPVPEGWRAAWDALFALCLSPLLLVAGLRLETPPALRRPFGFLGDVSYAVYAIHWPLIAIFGHRIEHLGLPPFATVLLFVAFALGAGTIAARFYDIPVRRWLGRRQHRRRAVPEQVLATP